MLTGDAGRHSEAAVRGCCAVTWFWICHPRAVLSSSTGRLTSALNQLNEEAWCWVLGAGVLSVAQRGRSAGAYGRQSEGARMRGS